MMSISKIILICYFLATKFSELQQYENKADRDAAFKLVKKEFEIELHKEDGFQMIDDIYKQRVWDRLFYERTLIQNLVTIELCLYILGALYLTVVFCKCVLYRIKKIITMKTKSD
jgi:predicted small integral membrane protein